MFRKALLFHFVLFATITFAQSEKTLRQPNVIVINADDLGWGDLSTYGNPTLITPNLDKMAYEGVKFTQFYAPAPVCTPSRAGLMTGSYPKRVGLHQGVLNGAHKHGLNPDEFTLPEVMKTVGYKTVMYGKWHLGHHKKFLPAQQGFDEFWGYPFSNDMSRKEMLKKNPKSKYQWQLPVLSMNDTIALDPDQTQSTKTLTNHALNYIRKNKADKFFMYLAHPMPHVPVYASEKFQGSSVRGIYGDAVEEIDHGIGLILEELKKQGIAENTIVMFTSDNGPWQNYGTRAGHAGPLRGAKGQTWEGGSRVPFIVWWPGTISGQRISTVVSSQMDIMPTLAAITGAKLSDNKIDGRDISEALFTNDQNYKGSQIHYFFTKQGDLVGVRDGAWKYIETYNKELGADEVCLFNLHEDLSERYNLLKENKRGDRDSKMVKKANELKKLMKSFDKELDKNKRRVGEIEGYNHDNFSLKKKSKKKKRK